MDLEDLRQWTGHSETAEDVIDPRRCAQLAGALPGDRIPSEGQALPLPWHWIFFTPVIGASSTGADGHPTRGGFLPPVPLPRRMWAGGRVQVEQPLLIGERATRSSRVADIAEKSGRQGSLVFVTVEHEYFNVKGDRVMRERQDIVYREPPVGTREKPGKHRAGVASHWKESVSPDPVLLFRYSALTYNAHRIHYDRDWAVTEEGYPGLVVQGPLIATLLLDLLERNRPDEQVCEFDFRGVSPLFDLAPFEIHGAQGGQGASLWALTPENALAMSMTCKLATN